MAALANGSITLLAPTLLAAIAVYRSETVRPVPPTALSSTLDALPVAAGALPIAVLVAWRTYVHAHAYRFANGSVWRGPSESAAIAGGLAAVIMLNATARTWRREPFHLVAAYIGFYVGATAFLGLVLGLALAATALLVLRLRRET